MRWSKAADQLSPQWSAASSEIRMRAASAGKACISADSLNVSDSLRQALLYNRDLRVFVATGYYDLATPILSTEWTINHLGLEPDMRKRIGCRYYEGGHMFYLHIPSLKRLKQDLDELVNASLKR